MGKLLPFTYLVYSSRNASICDGDGVVTVTVGPGNTICKDITYDFNITDTNGNYVNLRKANLDGNGFPPGITGTPKRYTYTTKTPWLKFTDEHFYHQMAGSYAFKVLSSTCSGAPHIAPSNVIMYDIIKDASSSSDYSDKPCPKPKGSPPLTQWSWLQAPTPSYSIMYMSGGCVAEGFIEGHWDTGVVPVGAPCNISFSVRVSITVNTDPPNAIPPGNIATTPDPPGTYVPHPWNSNADWVGGNATQGIYLLETTGQSTIADQTISFTNLYANDYIMEVIDCECNGTPGTPPANVGGTTYPDMPRYYSKTVAGQLMSGCCGSTPGSAILNTMPTGFPGDKWPHDQSNFGMNYPLGGTSYGPAPGTIQNPYNFPVGPYGAGATVPPPYQTSIPNLVYMANFTANIDYPNQSTLCEWCKDWWDGIPTGTWSSTGVFTPGGINPTGIGSFPGAFDQRVLNWSLLPTYLSQTLGYSFTGMSIAQAEEACSCCPDLLNTGFSSATWVIPPSADWVV